MQEKKWELGQLICHASVMFRRNFDNVVAAESAEYSDTVSGRNIWILRYIRDHADQDVFQKDLENVFKVRRSTISGTVERMEQKQLLVRESVDGDARLKRLRLTPKAEAILEAVSLGVKELEDRAKASFEEQDYDRLMQLLQQLCGYFEGLPDSNEKNKQERIDD